MTVQAFHAKIAWVRDKTAAPGAKANGSFDCPCGGKIEDVPFNGPDIECPSCGQQYTGMGWVK